MIGVAADAKACRAPNHQHACRFNYLRLESFPNCLPNAQTQLSCVLSTFRLLVTLVATAISIATTLAVLPAATESSAETSTKALILQIELVAHQLLQLGLLFRR
jgi:hypothetical protein